MLLNNNIYTPPSAWHIRLHKVRIPIFNRFKQFSILENLLNITRNSSGIHVNHTVTGLFAWFVSGLHGVACIRPQPACVTQLQQPACVMKLSNQLVSLSYFKVVAKIAMSACCSLHCSGGENSIHSRPYWACHFKSLLKTYSAG